MNAPTPVSTAASSPLHARLQLLLSRRSDGREHALFATASGETIEHARAVGRDVASEVVSEVLRAYGPGGDHGAAERAADVAYELRLTGAVPALVDCIERLSEGDPVAHASLRALERMPVEATEPLLAAYHRRPDVHARLCLGETLVRAAARGDDRVRAALVGLLAQDLVDAPGLVAEYGDARALPDLSRVLDALELPSPGKGELRRLEQIVAVAWAIHTLGGTRTGPQEAKFRRAYERSDELWADGGAEVDAFLDEVA